MSFFVLDRYSRKIIHFAIARHNPSAFWTINQLKQACSTIYGEPKHIFTDHGSQFDCNRFEGFCEAYGIIHRMGKKGSWKSNAPVERFHQSIKYEALNHILFLTKDQILKSIREYVLYYNEYRPHMALDGFTPEQKYSGVKSLPGKANTVVRKKLFCSGVITAY